MMQDVGRRYVRVFNDMYGTHWNLWEGRLSLDDRHRAIFLVCQRYIELNPVAPG